MVKSTGTRTIVLFVEDNEDLRQNAALVLGLEGYEVQVASDGQEALEYLEQGLHPNLIVSDIMMPRMDGYEFFEAVRQRPNLKGIPFIFLTARGSKRDVSYGRQIGADDYLIKPFEPEDFLIAVQNKLQRAAEIREQATEEFADARRLLVQMLSHELRTPLSYVTGGFALLAEELQENRIPASNDDVRMSLYLIQSGAQRLRRLAEQMVLYSEIMSGFIKQQVEKLSDILDLDSLVTDAIAQSSDIVEERSAEFYRSVSDNNGIFINGVKHLLVIAISEIIRNAAQYSHDNEVKIDLNIVCENDCAILTVTDSGKGISKKDQETIWDIMSQSERDRNEQQGAGMGLPIAKGIIDAHHCEIHLESTLGRGTRVTMKFPLASLD
jgi:two-component system, sensor histidine kinase and response regulator